jgi:hypothetical protein
MPKLDVPGRVPGRQMPPALPNIYQGVTTMHLQSRSKLTRSTVARTAGLLAAAAAVVLASACSSDTISAPAKAPEYRSSQFSIGGVTKTLFPMQPLTRNDPLTSPIVRTFTITKGGGKLEIKETGLRVDVPAGAISKNSLTITVTALAGSAVAYDFQPHGTVFLKPLDFQQELDGTSWERLRYKGLAVGGYFETVSQLSVLSGLALLDEVYPIMLDDKRASFDIRHFSGYLVSSGRQDTEDDGSGI